MPTGIPVATVALNGAKNAGILAARIISATDPEIGAIIDAYAQQMETAVAESQERLTQR
jgi:5-(carboxyamino)imidazole ribonucleotide mutase